MNALDCAALLGIAHAAVRHRLGVGPPPALPSAGPLCEPGGAFVTLKVKGELRGCMGTFTPSGSLALTVEQMAVAAANEDPRFGPVRPEDLDDLDVSISAVGERRRLHAPADIEVGRHGLVVQLGWHRGTLLPQMAVEEGWNALTFLERTCLKAGLPPQAWRDPEAVVEIFPADEIPDGGTGA
ncbi:MAG TPA: AmmeMemoRadiSam system protein A [Anaeromyxobacteraceae bacterium]|nr:AmmeMemoRadiSam system protein A [Anaeromyxobacteraceae bacterium]